MTSNGSHGGYNPSRVFTVIAIMLIVEALLFGPFLIEWIEWDAVHGIALGGSYRRTDE